MRVYPVWTIHVVLRHPAVIHTCRDHVRRCVGMYVCSPPNVDQSGLCIKEEPEGKVSEEESSADEDDMQSAVQPPTRPEARSTARTSKQHHRNHTRAEPVQTKTRFLELTDGVIPGSFHSQISNTSKCVLD